MRFKVVIGEQAYAIELPDDLLRESVEFHAKLDRDMDRGWQMSRMWVEKPDLYQRCQIVADRVLGALHTENKRMVLLMSGYILSRVPHVQEVVVDTSGDITLTEVVA